MITSRRRTLALLAGLPILGTAHGQSSAPYPNKPIKLIVPYPAGGQTDATARLFAQKAEAALGQPIVIENKPQAGGTLGVGEVARSAPDGHTWVLGFNGPLAFAPFLYKNLSYRPLQDLAPVILTTSQPNVLAVHPSVKAANLK